MNDHQPDGVVAEDPALTAALGDPGTNDSNVNDAGQTADEMPADGAELSGFSAPDDAPGAAPDPAEMPDDGRAPSDPTPADEADEAAALYRAFPYLPEAGRAAMVSAPRYAALRALGLSAREAALATFGELPAAGVAGQGKGHLTAVAGRVGVDPLPTMSEAEYAMARTVFGESVSDAELEALFRRVR